MKDHGKGRVLAWQTQPVLKPQRYPFFLSYPAGYRTAAAAPFPFPDQLSNGHGCFLLLARPGFCAVISGRLLTRRSTGSIPCVNEWSWLLTSYFQRPKRPRGKMPFDSKCGTISASAASRSSPGQPGAPDHRAERPRLGNRSAPAPAGQHQQGGQTEADPAAQERHRSARYWNVV